MKTFILTEGNYRENALCIKLIKLYLPSSFLCVDKRRNHIYDVIFGYRSTLLF